MVAYIRITRWALGQMEIFRPYVFTDCLPGTVKKSSSLGTFANTAEVNDAHVSHFMSSETSKIDKTATLMVNSCLFFLALEEQY